MATQSKSPLHDTKTKDDHLAGDPVTLQPVPSSQSANTTDLAIKNPPKSISNGHHTEPADHSCPVETPKFSTVDGNGHPLSKSKLKKLRKDREWEEGRDARRAKRKEKRSDKQAQKRADRAAAAITTTATPHAPTPNGLDQQSDHNDDEMAQPPAKRPKLSPPDLPSLTHKATTTTTNTALNPPTTLPRPPKPKQTPLPLTLILDCSYDPLMTPLEIKSLSTQITRAYSDCSRARHPPGGGLIISSFGGQLKARFDTVLMGHYKEWKKVGVRFTEKGFAEVAREVAAENASSAGVGTWELGGAFADLASASTTTAAGTDADANPSHLPNGNDPHPPSTAPSPEPIYLTPDTPSTLPSLLPHGIYIIGGLVDKNRHKGICYKRAQEAGIATAKLPIDEFMQLKSRQVLATNHVVEILLRWLEGGGWGGAFERVIPGRKGGRLRGGDGSGEMEGKKGEGGKKGKGEGEGDGKGKGKGNGVGYTDKGWGPPGNGDGNGNANGNGNGSRGDEDPPSIARAVALKWKEPEPTEDRFEIVEEEVLLLV